VQELQVRLQLERRVGEEESVSVEELENPGDRFTSSLRPFFERTLRLPVPMRDAKVFLKLLQLDLAANPPGAPVTKIWIAAEPASPRSAQRGLFLPITPEAEKLEITLARINAVVGEQRSGIARLLDTHRPQGFQMQRFMAPAESEANRKSDASLQKSDSALAMRIIRPPCRLRVQVSDGRPVALSTESREGVRAELQGTIVWSAGPWRSSGEWWTEAPQSDDSGTEQPGTWDREEWDVALSKSSGNVTLYRIYRDIASGSWFADAGYD
jgi:protein ImuB